MQRDRVVEAWRRVGAFLQILGHSGVVAGDVPGDHLLREASTVRRWNLQRLEFLFAALRALEQERYELRMADGAGYPDISLRAVDLPEEAVAVPRHPAAIVNGDGCAVGQYSAHQYLVRSGHRQRLAGIGDKRRGAPSGEHRRYICELAQHICKRSERMSHRNRQHGGATSLVEQIGIVFLLRDDPAPATASRD